MANEFATNFAFTSANHTFSAIWKLTRVMKKAGWTFKASGDGVTPANKSASIDYWGSAGDPLTDVYPAAFDAGSPWIVLEGPATIKIPVTSALNSNFIRGEKVSQAISLAEGELLGHVFDSVGVTGYAVVLARDSITWTTNIITGATSGQTFTPSSTPRKFRRQVVFWKSSANTTDGYVYYICSDESGSASTDGLFSDDSSYAGTRLYAQASTTGVIAPGGTNTSGNRLPTKAMVLRGTLDIGTGAPAPVATSWLHSTVSFGTVAQIVAANNIPTSSISPDGTFWISANYTAPANAINFFGFFRMDDQEPGDVDPFVWNYQTSTNVSSFSRNTGTGSFSGQGYWYWAAITSTSTVWKGYCARGLTGSVKDDVTYFHTTYLTTPVGAAFQIMTLNSGTGALRVANHPAATTPFVREPVKIFSDRTNMKIFKGSVRWMFYAQTGAAYDTADNKTFFYLLSVGGATNPAVMVGPYDGTTTPIYP